MESTHAGKKFIRALKIRLSEYSESRKQGLKIITKEKLKEPFNALLHPIKEFNAIKTEGHGSAAVATIIWLCFFIISVLEYFEVGFVFNYNQPKKFNIFYQFAVSAAIVLVWCISFNRVLVLIPVLILCFQIQTKATM